MTTAFRALDSFVVFGLLMLWAVVVSRVLERRRSEPPAELVAAISGWPPPVLGWGPPNPLTRVA